MRSVDVEILERISQSLDNEHKRQDSLRIRNKMCV